MNSSGSDLLRSNLQSAADSLREAASVNPAPEIVSALDAAEMALTAISEIGLGECHDADPPADIFIVIENGQALLRCAHDPSHTVPMCG